MHSLIITLDMNYLTLFGGKEVMLCMIGTSKIRVPLSEDEFRRPGDLDFSLSLGVFWCCEMGFGTLFGHYTGGICSDLLILGVISTG